MENIELSGRSSESATTADITEKVPDKYLHKTGKRLLMQQRSKGIIPDKSVSVIQRCHKSPDNSKC